MSSSPSVARQGFTLKELLITIAIIGVLAAIILPLLQRQGPGSPGRRSTCLNNVKNVALACAYYESTNSQFPPVIGSKGESFLVRILPMLDQKAMFDDFRSASSGAEGIDNVARNGLEVLRCPSAASSDFQVTENGSFTSHYAGCAGFAKPISATSPTPVDAGAAAAPPSIYTMGPGDLGLNGLFSPKLNDDGTLNIGTKNGLDTTKVVDGMSNTMAIIETSRGNFKSGQKTFTNARLRWSWGVEPTTPNQVNWGRSVDRMINSFDDVNGKANPLHGICISSNHVGGANVANGDGSVHFVSDDIDLEVLQAVAGINDGIEADLDD